VNRSLPVGGAERCLEKTRFRRRRNELDVSDGRTEPGRESQIAGAAARKKREPKVRLVRGTCKKLAKNADPRTREGCIA